MRASKVAWVLLAGLSGCASMPMPRSVADPVFVPRPCAFEATQVACGSVFVPEDHAAPQGRKIALNVIVFKALAPTPGDSAQFDLEGGPGFAVTDSAAFYAGDGEAYRRARDVVLVDMEDGKVLPAPQGDYHFTDAVTEHE